MQQTFPQVISTESEFSYFDLQARWGATKHLGGLEATDELAARCGINAQTIVLEVGSGVGLSACHLARRYGCYVMGVDLSERMVAWARRRAERKSLDGQVEFRTADARRLPFADGAFHVVICESVTAFVPDKDQALREYVRVTKPGGVIGLNEGTWLQAPPTDLADYVDRTMAHAHFLSADGWRSLLEAARLTDIQGSVHRLDWLRQRLNETRGLDIHDTLDRLRAWGDFLSLYASNARFRQYTKTILPSRRIIGELFTYLGYGIYVGRKA